MIKEEIDRYLIGKEERRRTNKFVVIMNEIFQMLPEIMRVKGLLSNKLERSEPLYSNKHFRD